MLPANRHAIDMPVALSGADFMKICEIKNKIPEVWAYAKVIVQRYGHTRKYAKHIAALVIKQTQHFSDRELAEFLSINNIGSMLGYKHNLSFTIFSKVRKESLEIMKELYESIVYSRMKDKRIRLVAQDSTDIHAFSSKDKDARYGHRTPSKVEQRTLKNKSKTLFFGYKLHAGVDAETELPIAVEIASANRHDKMFFHKVYETMKKMFRIHLNSNAKFLADAAYDATDIYKELHYDGIRPVIAINGRGFYKSKVPKDPEYGKRWSVERVFSRLKEVFGLAKNRFIGEKKVSVHIYSCLVAYVCKYG